MGEYDSRHIAGVRREPPNAVPRNIIIKSNTIGLAETGAIIHQEYRNPGDDIIAMGQEEIQIGRQIIGKSASMVCISSWPSHYGNPVPAQSRMVQ
jgi:phosphoribosylformylglycinamidine (FGAM) synthase-like enzyme